MHNTVSRQDSPSRAAGRRAWLLACLALLLSCATARAQAPTVTEINPKQATINLSGPNGGSGGRVNSLSRVASDPRVFYAASEWGGLYRSLDRGRNWSRLNGHIPTSVWDVEVSPVDPNRVIATSYYDGRVRTLAGISVSTDGGLTWTRPPSATPPPNFCADAVNRGEPSAFGISFDPANPRNVYVGTNCGLAVSADAGLTWRYLDPTPNTRAHDIRDVIVHNGGIVDVCGRDGHYRRASGATAWRTATGPDLLPAGVCSLAVSPDESYVLFAVVGTEIFETDDGGASWRTSFVNPSAQGRVPFVATNQRQGAAFDLWFGDTGLYRANCRTPATPQPGGSPRCPGSHTWAGSFTTQAGGHDDVGDIIFDAAAADDACPTLFASDGGVYYNTRTTSPACHNPAWAQPDVTPHGLWLFGMAGAHLAGAEAEALYFVNQDTGIFATREAGAGDPRWSTIECCDGFDVSADATRVVYTVCCYSPPPANRLFVRGVGMSGGGEIKTYPDGDIPTWRTVGALDQFGPNNYVLVTTVGTFITSDIAANPVDWIELRAETGNPVAACGVKASVNNSAPVFYVQGGTCSGRGDPATGRDRVWKHEGTQPDGSWEEVRPPGGVGGFGIFDVDPTNPQRIIASHLTNSQVRMVMSRDGGRNWQPLPLLDALMTGNGVFKYQTLRGPTDFNSFGGYPQPTLVSFDPQNPNIIVAGAADAGLFYSTDGGATWRTITNNSGTASQPIIPRPRFAYFDHENGNIDIYVGTQGRGAWRVRIPNP